jgi:hypothetical protein
MFIAALLCPFFKHCDSGSSLWVFCFFCTNRRRQLRKFQLQLLKTKLVVRLQKLGEVHDHDLNRVALSGRDELPEANQQD